MSATAGTGPINLSGNLSKSTTLPDLVRFFSSFATQVSTQFNNLISTKLIYGSIGASGVAVIGSETFGITMPAVGAYLVTFREAFHTRPIALGLPEQVGGLYASGVTTTQVTFRTTLVGVTTPANAAFSFAVFGRR